MPRLRTFAEILTDLERLLAAADNNAGQLPGLELTRVPLETAIASLRSLSSRRDALNADKQALSAELKGSVQEARDAGSQFRGFVRSHLGMRNEKMVEFRVPPRRLGVRTRKGSLKAPAAQPAPNPVSAVPSAATPVIAPSGAVAKPEEKGGATGHE